MATNVPSHRTEAQAVSNLLLHQHPPGKTLDAAYKYCDPRLSLAPESDASLHADLAATRGGDRLGEIRRAIRRAGDDLGSLHLLSGHMGSGKTTELRRLACDLGREEPHPTVVYFDAEALLRLPVADLEDILIGLWLVLSGDGPAPLPDAVPMPGDVGQRAKTLLGTWWRDRIRNQLVRLSADLPDDVVQCLRAVLAQLKGAASTDSEPSPWRLALRPVAQTLLEGLNAAIAEMRGDDGPPVVFVVDQLEKLQPGPHVESLYGQRLVDLKLLHAHVVMTVPLHLLCYGATGARLIASVYGTGAKVLPMVKVGERVALGDGPYASGIQAMAQLLALRVDFERLFEDGRGAAARIASLSGGSIRHALQLTQSAINLHDQPKVTAASIDRVAADMTASYERALPDAWVDDVVYVYRHNSFRSECPAATKGELLYNLFVLEYQNGDSDPWHGVHPLVLKTRKVQARLDASAG